MWPPEPKFADEITKRSQRPLPPCGNPKCLCSTGIHGGLTFGSGKLDESGFWEHPCDICARAQDAKRVKNMIEFANALRAKNMSEQEIEKKLHEEDWLMMEAWPFNTKGHK